MVDRWHYTVGQRWEQIRSSGSIRPAIAGVPKGERPVAWFSRREPHEPTATTLMRDSASEVRQASELEIKLHLGGRVRVGVAPQTAPHDWAAFVRLSGISQDMADGLVQAARERGADPGDWFASFDPVPAAAWRAVEWWFAGAWQPMHDWVPAGPDAAVWAE